MFRSRKPIVHLLSLLLSLLCVASMALPTLAAENKDHTHGFYTAAVRNWAGDSAASIGQLKDGTLLTVLGTSGSYYKIDCYGMTGYIAMSQVETVDGEYYVNCKTDSTETLTLSTVSVMEGLAVGLSVEKLAKSKLGCPYVYGAAGPYSFDCSGFTSYVYGQSGITVHRTASTQLQDGLIVSPEEMRAGDLVFFRDPGSGDLASHVGIYMGDGQMIHAGSQGIVYASLDTEYFAQRFLCARRYISVNLPFSDQICVA